MIDTKLLGSIIKKSRRTVYCEAYRFVSFLMSKESSWKKIKLKNPIGVLQPSGKCRFSVLLEIKVGYISIKIVTPDINRSDAYMQALLRWKTWSHC